MLKLEPRPQLSRFWSYGSPILALRDAGCAVLVVSEELDELFEISDRLYVIAKGRLSPSIDRAAATVPQIGEWMSGLWSGQPHAAKKEEVAHA